METNYNMSTVFTKKSFNFACIYKLTSPSGKIYIGQTQCLYKRFQDYRKPKANEYLMKAILKYGLENISVEILERGILLENLDEREQFYLDTLQPFNDNGYNICREASTTRGRKRPIEEIKGVTAYMTGRFGELNHFYGRKHTEESKQKQREAKRDKILSEEHINLFCGAGQESVKKKVNQVDKTTLELIKTWDFIRLAANTLLIHESSITNACKGKYKTAGGFKWEYC